MVQSVSPLGSTTNDLGHKEFRYTDFIYWSPKDKRATSEPPIQILQHLYVTSRWKNCPITAYYSYKRKRKHSVDEIECNFTSFTFLRSVYSHLCTQSRTQPYSSVVTYFMKSDRVILPANATDFWEYLQHLLLPVTLSETDGHGELSDRESISAVVCLL